MSDSLSTEPGTPQHDDPDHVVVEGGEPVHLADRPVLVVDFDRAGVVTAARWRRPEVDAPAPIAPTAGGQTQTEISSAE